MLPRIEEAKAKDITDEKGGKTLAGTISWQRTFTRIQLIFEVCY
jgi:hypothetical protein